MFRTVHEHFFLSFNEVNFFFFFGGRDISGEMHSGPFKYRRCTCTLSKEWVRVLRCAVNVCDTVNGWIVKTATRPQNRILVRRCVAVVDLVDGRAGYNSNKKRPRSTRRRTTFRAPEKLTGLNDCGI